jgi:hypothetical protein
MCVRCVEVGSGRRRRLFPAPADLTLSDVGKSNSFQINQTGRHTGPAAPVARAAPLIRICGSAETNPKFATPSARNPKNRPALYQSSESRRPQQNTKQSQTASRMWLDERKAKTSREFRRTRRSRYIQRSPHKTRFPSRSLGRGALRPAWARAGIHPGLHSRLRLHLFVSVFPRTWPLLT